MNKISRGSRDIKGIMAKKEVVSSGEIDRAILLIRYKRVMLDADLALVFGTTTKRLNERVK